MTSGAGWLWTTDSEELAVPFDEMRTVWYDKNTKPLLLADEHALPPPEAGDAVATRPLKDQRPSEHERNGTPATQLAIKTPHTRRARGAADHSASASCRSTATPHCRQARGGWARPRVLRSGPGAPAPRSSRERTRAWTPTRALDGVSLTA